METTKQATTTTTKQCKNCKEVKPLTEFYRHNAYPDGRIHRCKTCVSEQEKKKRGSITKKEDKLREFWKYSIHPITGYAFTIYNDRHKLRNQKK